jgi:peptidoglycan hydrolase-like protein with peptidoglycan-binding domain
MSCVKRIIIGILSLALTTVMISTIAHAEVLSVIHAQSILKKMNYYPDALNGSMSPATIKSIITFQADFNLKTTGRLDARTCRTLLAEEEKINDVIEKNKQEKVVSDAQTKLKSLFYYFGPISGKRGDISKTAISDFQKDNGLIETGTLDEQTLTMILSDTPQPKKPSELSARPVPPEPSAPKKIEAEVKNEGPMQAPNAEPKDKKTTPDKPEVKKQPLNVQPLWSYSMGHMNYKPSAGYDAATYEAQNETLHPEQAVIYNDESFTMARLALDYAPFCASLSTSRLGGGDNAADSLDFSWYFNLKKKPYLLYLQYENIESDALVDNDIIGIETNTFTAEWLYRQNPWLFWGLGVSYGNLPTLVSCKNEMSQNRAIGFDKDFKLATLNAVVRYNSLAKDKKPIFKTKHLYPYVTSSFSAGFGYGKVSDDVIDRMNADLNHSFSGAIYTLNLKCSPEVGLTYQLHRPSFDLDLTLGYALTFHLPNWSIRSLPALESNDQVEFYRRNIRHGPVIGGNISF